MALIENALHQPKTFPGVNVTDILNDAMLVDKEDLNSYFPHDAASDSTNVGTVNSYGVNYGHHRNYVTSVAPASTCMYDPNYSMAVDNSMTQNYPWAHRTPSTMALLQRSYPHGNPNYMVMQQHEQPASPAVRCDSAQSYASSAASYTPHHSPASPSTAPTASANLLCHSNSNSPAAQQPQYQELVSSVS
jgi:hypothetical protein